MEYGHFGKQFGNYMRLVPALLLFMCASTRGASASTIACAPNTLANVAGFTMVCGSVIYDFTNTGTGFSGTSSFGTPLGLNDIIVSANANNINFSVDSNSYTLDPANNPIAASKGLFYANGADTGYTVYTIPFGISIGHGYWFNGITTTASNLHFGNHNGGSDLIDVQKIAQFAPSQVYSADADTGQIDTSSGSGDVNIPLLTSGFNSFDANMPNSIVVTDTLTLNPTSTNPVAIWVGPSGFSQAFSTPEPITMLSLGSALVLLGMLKRKKRA